MRLLFLISFGFLLFTSDPVLGQEIGGDGKLPEINLENLNGQKVNLQSYGENDKVTIIAFWATWCKPCKKELENINALLPDWKKRFDAELIAVSIDDSRNSRKVKPYVNGRGWQFDVLLDPNKDTKRALNFAAIPYSMLVDKDGKIVYQHSGYSEGAEFELEDKMKALKREEE